MLMRVLEREYMYKRSKCMNLTGEDYARYETNLFLVKEQVAGSSVAFSRLENGNYLSFSQR